MTPTAPKEADERAAPLVFAYIVAVLGWLIGIIAWVFWFRGYA